MELLLKQICPQTLGQMSIHGICNPSVLKPLKYILFKNRMEILNFALEFPLLSEKGPTAPPF